MRSHQYYSTGFSAVEQLGEQVQGLNIFGIGAEVMSKVVKLCDSLEYVGASSDQDIFRKFIGNLRKSAKSYKEVAYSWEKVEALSTCTLQNLQANVEGGLSLLEAPIKLLDLIVFGGRATEALSVEREVTGMVVAFKQDSDAAQKALGGAKKVVVGLATWSYEARAKIRLALHDAQLAHDNYVNHPWRRALCWIGIFPDTSKMSADMKALEVTNAFLSIWVSKARELEIICRVTKRSLGLFTTHIEEQTRRSQLEDFVMETELRVADELMNEDAMHVKEVFHDTNEMGSWDAYGV